VPVSVERRTARPSGDVTPAGLRTGGGTSMEVGSRTAPGASRYERLRRALDPREWATVSAMVATIIGLHVIGWVTLVAIIAPRHYHVGTGSQVFGVGLGLTAYTLGLRHAFDADHIAAIDNTTRKLMSDGQRPLSVGFFFSLGHSTIVFALSFLFSVGVRTLAGQVADDGSTLHNVAGWIGTTISGGFLYLIAAINLVVLVGIVTVFRDMRRGYYDEAALEDQLNSRGLMNRVLGRFTKAITKPWQMYPLGLLFGLGFDTATEVALLFLAAGAAGAGLPWYAILVLPILFAAGMSLLDTIDGSFMNFAYGWAFSKPVRKVYYNITITGLSVAVAFIIGSIELLGILAQKANLTGGFWGWIANLDLNVVGYFIVALFVGTWAVALLVWKYGRIEEKWTAGSRESGQVEPAN
jgi:nickel/cobalt transporter (NiCoT) family protein